MRLFLALIVSGGLLAAQAVPQTVITAPNAPIPLVPEVETQVRTAITALSAALAQGAQQAEPLFSIAGAPDIAPLLAYFRPPDRPLSEVTPWRTSVREARALGPAYVLVEADLVQFGSQIVAKRVPLLLLMKRGSERWLVDVARTLEP